MKCSCRSELAVTIMRTWLRLKGILCALSCQECIRHLWPLVYDKANTTSAMQVAEWREEGKADIVPGVLFIDEVHILSVLYCACLASPICHSPLHR